VLIEVAVAVVVQSVAGPLPRPLIARQVGVDRLNPAGQGVADLVSAGADTELDLRQWGLEPLVGAPVAVVVEPVADLIGGRHVAHTLPPVALLVAGAGAGLALAMGESARAGLL